MPAACRLFGKWVHLNQQTKNPQKAKKKKQRKEKTQIQCVLWIWSSTYCQLVHCYFYMQNFYFKEFQATFLAKTVHIPKSCPPPSWWHPFLRSDNEMLLPNTTSEILPGTYYDKLYCYLQNKMLWQLYSPTALCTYS